MATETFGRCPARSPESGVQCDLRDDPTLHVAGHEAYQGGGEWRSWATTAADTRRWSEATNG